MTLGEGFTEGTFDFQITSKKLPKAVFERGSGHGLWQRCYLFADGMVLMTVTPGVESPEPRDDRVWLATLLRGDDCYEALLSYLKASKSLDDYVTWLDHEASGISFTFNERDLEQVVSGIRRERPRAM